eukprot:scaffold41791_cov29-Tisochrysis_lutea.AAC.3
MVMSAPSDLRCSFVTSPDTIRVSWRSWLCTSSKRSRRPALPFSASALSVSSVQEMDDTAMSVAPGQRSTHCPRGTSQ